MSIKVKRKRGGASVPCPRCGSSSRVVETRRVELEVVRWRVCSHKKQHRFRTEEKVADQ